MFMAPWSRNRLKKMPGAEAGAGWEKNQEPQPFKKKSVGVGIVVGINTPRLGGEFGVIEKTCHLFAIGELTE